MTTDIVLQELITLAHQLGREDRQLVTLSEGSVSTAPGDGTFWVKAAGARMAQIESSGFSQVQLEPIAQLMATPRLNDALISDGLHKALVDPAQAQPSTETFLHAICLTEGLAQWVGHVHPISTNRILCSHWGAEPFLQHISPGTVSVCGKVPVVVPYVEPGLSMALTLKEALKRHLVVYQQSPKLVLLVNHGIIALGQTAQEVEAITLMTDKWARILQGTFALAGPHFLPESEVNRIGGSYLAKSQTTNAPNASTSLPE